MFFVKAAVEAFGGKLCSKLIKYWVIYLSRTVLAAVCFSTYSLDVQCPCVEQLVIHAVILRTAISYTLSREYRVVRNRYSRLLFTSEDRLCANLRVQEQSTNMTSQCQYPAFG